MTHGSHFTVAPPEAPGHPCADFTTECLMDRLRLAVAARFQRITGIEVLVLLVDAPLTEAQRAWNAGRPAHPTCTDADDPDACRTNWVEHLDELRTHYRPHWHRCGCGRWCGVVPVALNQRCLAACKFVAPAELRSEAFGQLVELLAALVESFIARQGEYLDRLVASAAEVADMGSDGKPTPFPREPQHPQVHEALDHIAKHLTESKMNVARIAQTLGMNASYLAHLFAEQTGIRMSRYIALRRIELAKTLLVTTDWQVKRVAYESGHTNADWFSQTFKKAVGLSPIEYRRRVRNRER